MKHLTTYKLFESTNMGTKSDTIKDVFTDLEFEENGLEWELEKISESWVVRITKLGKYEHSQDVDEFRKKLDSIFIDMKEYRKIHDLIMSKITYLSDIDIECINVMYSIMDSKYKQTTKSLSDYFSKNKDMRGFLEYLFVDEDMGILTKNIRDIGMDLYTNKILMIAVAFK